MIEVVPDKPEITAELALSAARVLRDFCGQHKQCEDCQIVLMNICGWYSSSYPENWDIPERGNSNGKTE